MTRCRLGQGSMGVADRVTTGYLPGVDGVTSGINVSEEEKGALVTPFLLPLPHTLHPAKERGRERERERERESQS